MDGSLAEYVSILKIKEEKENKIMGITCKAAGKMKGILRMLIIRLKLT